MWKTVNMWRRLNVRKIEEIVKDDKECINFNVAHKQRNIGNNIHHIPQIIHEKQNRFLMLKHKSQLFVHIFYPFIF